MSRVNEARKEISSITQDGDEKFSKSWGRFKDLLIRCPPHGYKKWWLVQFFYQGLSQPNRSVIESMNGGAFLNLTGDLAYKALDKLADNSQQWDFTSCQDKPARSLKKGGIHELKGKTQFNLKMDAIVKRLDALNMGWPICASPTHQAQNCPSMIVFFEMEQVNAFNNFWKQSSGPYSKTYNPGWRNHLKFFMEAEPTHESRRNFTSQSKSISSRIPSVVFQSCSPSSCIFTIINFVRQTECSHPIKWSYGERI